SIASPPPTYALLSLRSISFLLPAPPPPQRCPLSLHDALPISDAGGTRRRPRPGAAARPLPGALVHVLGDRFRARPGCGRHETDRSEEHTSELQSHLNLVCRLLLEKKKKTTFNIMNYDIAIILP